MSIRYKIFGAFSVVILLACGLAFYGIRGISDSGDLVVRLYDGPLMGINHARSAHAALNEARLVMYRSSVEGRRSKDALRSSRSWFAARQRRPRRRARPRPGANVEAAREKAEARLNDWSASVLKILKPAQGGQTEIPATFVVAAAGR